MASRKRAYQWMHFLGPAGRAADALAALQSARSLLAKAEWPRRPSLAGQALSVEYYPNAYLYRLQPEARSVRLTLAPGYVYAPAEVLESALRAAVGYGRLSGRARQAWRHYAAGDEFAEVSIELELSTEPPVAAQRGERFDLGEVFERVNARYFSGQLARPQLAWSRGALRSLHGYYEHATDRLVVSRALDRPGAPAGAIELVMYHELLHKALGLNVVNGRHVAHTPAFREREMQFEGFEAARRFLEGRAG